MPKWNEVRLEDVEIDPGKGRTRPRFHLPDGPLKFQLPRGVCTWGVSPEYKTFQVSIQDEAFVKWYESLEKKLCSDSPFHSNIIDGSLRLKVDEGTLFFKSDGSLLVDGPDRMKGADVSCIMEIPSSWFFQEKYGLTCRAAQVRIWSGAAPSAEPFGSPVGSPVPRRLLLDDE